MVYDFLMKKSRVFFRFLCTQAAHGSSAKFLVGCDAARGLKSSKYVSMQRKAPRSQQKNGNFVLPRELFGNKCLNFGKF